MIGSMMDTMRRFGSRLPATAADLRWRLGHGSEHWIALGRRAYQGGKYMSAYDCWNKAAAGGDGEGAFLIGELYVNGRGLERNIAEAAAWFRRASEAHHAEATYRLAGLLLDPAPEPPKDTTVTADAACAVLYPRGRQLAADPAEAVRLLQAAVASGHVKACALLGSLYLSGRGVERDAARARDCYQIAADAGNAAGQFGLGDIYFQGLGIAPDPAVAADWYEQAALQGHDRAMLALAHLHYHGQGRPKDRSMAIAIIAVAADLDNSEALFRLGEAHFQGTDATPDVEKAETLFRKASRLGHPVACRALGDLYDSLGDTVQAMSWYRVAAERNEPRAHFMLGQYAVTGTGMPADLAAAALHLEAAASLGHIEAAHNVGCLYVAGSGVAKDLAKGRRWIEAAAAAGLPAAKVKIARLDLDSTPPAISDRTTADGGGADLAVTWLRAAADAGNANAQFDLGVLFCEGRGTAKDVAAGATHFRSAAEQGHVVAAYNFGIMCLRGDGVEADRTLAQAYLESAARAGSIEAAGALEAARAASLLEPEIEPV